jgi:hypothetical protein
MNTSKKKFSLDTLLGMMIPRHRVVCNRIRADFSPQFNLIPGSSYNHQTWQGGYRDHIEEIMNVACILYDSLSKRRPLKFSLSEGLFVLFLHDMDKLHRYEVVNGHVIRKYDYAKGFIEKTKLLLKKSYAYVLSPKEANALEYVHGEGKDYSSKRRVMNELAAFVHCCDIISARIWFDKGSDERYW